MSLLIIIALNLLQTKNRYKYYLRICNINYRRLENNTFADSREIHRESSHIRQYHQLILWMLLNRRMHWYWILPHRSHSVYKILEEKKLQRWIQRRINFRLNNVKLLLFTLRVSCHIYGWMYAFCSVLLLSIKLCINLSSYVIFFPCQRRRRCLFISSIILCPIFCLFCVTRISGSKMYDIFLFSFFGDLISELNFPRYIS